jgi:hypothetical protein
MPYIGKIVKEKKDALGTGTPELAAGQAGSSLDLVFEAVADAADRLDAVPPRTELLSQTGDLDVNGPAGDHIVAAVERVHDLVACEDQPRRANWLCVRRPMIGIFFS